MYCYFCQRRLYKGKQCCPKCLIELHHEQCLLEKQTKDYLMYEGRVEFEGVTRARNKKLRKE